MLGISYVNFYFTTPGTLDLYLISYDLQVESETIWLKQLALILLLNSPKATNQPTNKSRIQTTVLNWKQVKH